MSITSHPGTHGPFHRQQRWATWWVVLFTALTVGLLAAVALRAPFYPWAIVAACTWLPMELFGVVASPTDAYPPLTEITREYVPRWVTFPVIYGAVALGGGTWFHFHRRWWLAALGALLGWLSAHFDVTYDLPAVRQESLKYAWYAKRLPLRPAVQQRIISRINKGQQAREQEAARLGAAAPPPAGDL